MIGDLPTGISHVFDVEQVKTLAEVQAFAAKGYAPVTWNSKGYLVVRARALPRTISVSSASRERGGDV